MLAAFARWDANMIQCEIIPEVVVTAMVDSEARLIGNNGAAQQR